MSVKRLKGKGFLDLSAYSVPVLYEILVRDIPGGIPDARGALALANDINHIPTDVEVLQLRLEDNRIANISIQNYKAGSLAQTFVVQGVIA